MMDINVSGRIWPITMTSIIFMMSGQDLAYNHDGYQCVQQNLAYNNDTNNFHDVRQNPAYNHDGYQCVRQNPAYNNDTNNFQHFWRYKVSHLLIRSSPYNSHLLFVIITSGTPKQLNVVCYDNRSSY